MYPVLSVRILLTRLTSVLCVCVCVWCCCLTPATQTANLAEANASEEDKIRAMMSQSNHDYDPIQWVRRQRGALGPEAPVTRSLGPSWTFLWSEPPPCPPDILSLDAWCGDMYLDHHFIHAVGLSNDLSVPLSNQLHEEAIRAAPSQLHLLPLWQERPLHQELSNQWGNRTHLWCPLQLWLSVQPISCAHSTAYKDKLRCCLFFFLLCNLLTAFFPVLFLLLLIQMCNRTQDSPHWLDI